MYWALITKVTLEFQVTNIIIITMETSGYTKYHHNITANQFTELYPEQARLSETG